MSTSYNLAASSVLSGSIALSASRLTPIEVTETTHSSGDVSDDIIRNERKTKLGPGAKGLLNRVYVPSYPRRAPSRPVGLATSFRAVTEVDAKVNIGISEKSTKKRKCSADYDQSYGPTCHNKRARYHGAVSGGNASKRHLLAKTKYSRFNKTTWFCIRGQFVYYYSKPKTMNPDEIEKGYLGDDESSMPFAENSV
jgi:hypothetical protein